MKREQWVRAAHVPFIRGEQRDRVSRSMQHESYAHVPDLLFK